MVTFLSTFSRCGLGVRTVALLCFPLGVAAEPLELLKLTLVAPSNCPDRAAFLGALRRELAASRAPDVRLAARIHVTNEGPSAWSAQLHLSNASGESTRVIVARTCPALFDAMSLILATVIDPELVGQLRVDEQLRTIGEPRDDGSILTAENSDHESTVPPNLGAVATSTTMPQTKPTQEASRTDAKALELKVPASKAKLVGAARIHTEPRMQSDPIASRGPSSMSPPAIAGYVAAMAAADWGSLPGLTPTISASVGLGSRTFRGELRLGWWRPQEQTTMIASTSTTSHFGLVASGLRSCYFAWTSSRLAVGPCGDVELGYWSAQGDSRVAVPHHTKLWGASAGAGGLVHLQVLDIMALRGEVSALVPISRPGFGYYADGRPIEVFRPSALLLRAGFGCEVNFL